MNSAPAVSVVYGGLLFLAMSVVRLAMYCEEGVVFLPETAAFQGLVESVPPVWMEGCPTKSEQSCGKLDGVRTKVA